MNKNVLKYLNGKAQQVTDYIRTKAEAAGNYLSEHAQDIKQSAIKATATVLTAAALLGGMTGCAKYKDVIMFPIASMKELEEIQEAGITAEDVLAVYDNFCLQKLYETFLHHKEDYGDDWYNFSAQFQSIKTHKRILQISNNDVPEYDYIHEPFYHMFNDEGYCLTYNFYGALNNDSREFSKNVQIVPVTFESLMDSLNVSPFSLTDEYWQNNPQHATDYNYPTGVDVYEPITIDRETIINATEEQLWKLYNVGIEITNHVMKQLQEKQDELNSDKQK